MDELKCKLNGGKNNFESVVLSRDVEAISCPCLKGHFEESGCNRVKRNRTNRVGQSFSRRCGGINHPKGNCSGIPKAHRQTNL